MSDLAFNNYCLVCDQLCMDSAVYCSDSCKHVDETQASLLRATQEHLPELVSPLLAPACNHNTMYEDSSYTHCSDSFSIDNIGSATENFQPISLEAQHSYNDEYLTTSPLMLLGNKTIPSDLDYHAFNLNSSSDSNILSTSHNYRKWLTACL